MKKSSLAIVKLTPATAFVGPVGVSHGDPRAVAEESVLRRLRAGNHNLLVMGVSPRPGESLAFGHVAAAVLARSEHSILFVSS